MISRIYQDDSKNENGGIDFSQMRLRFPKVIGPLTRDAFCLAFGQGVVALAMLLGMRVITELVSQSVYGQVSLLVGITLLGRQTFAFPYLQAALRLYPDAVATNEVPIFRKIIRTNLLKTVAISMTLLLIGGIIYTSLNNDISFILFAIAAGLLACDVALTLDTDLYNAARNHRHFVTITIGNAWLRPGLAVLAIYFLGSTAGAVLGGYFAATFLVLILLRILPVQRVGVVPGSKSSNNINELSKQIHKYAFPLIPLAVVGWVSSLSDRYLIAAFIDMKSVGLYAAAYNLMSMPFNMVQAVIERSLRPVYFDAVSSGNRTLANHHFSLWLISVLTICTVGVVCVFFFCDFIVHICLASGYYESAVFMPWIALGHFFLATSQVYENRCLAFKKPSYVLMIRTGGAALSLIIAIPFIRYYGLSGAAWAVPVYFGAQLLLSILFSGKITIHKGFV
jgi:O-antigen/teichoic acid export membrane protein